MRVAALYDIHANLPALEAVLQDIHQAEVDHVVVGGDVLPGPMPRETLTCLLGLDIPVQFIHGNGDREVLAQMAGTETDWYRTAPEQWREPVRCGHTHMQFDRTIGRIRVVNAGSVGMPFGEPGADWLLLGPDVQLRHTSYDFAKAAERIRDTKYPQAQEFAARNVLQPPSEGETLEAFTRVELR